MKARYKTLAEIQAASPQHVLTHREQRFLKKHISNAGKITDTNCGILLFDPSTSDIDMAEQIINKTVPEGSRESKIIIFKTK